MKLLQVVPYFYPAWSYGGPGKLVFDISKEMIRRGHDVSVYTSDAYDATSRMPENQKEKIFSVSYFANLSNYLAFSKNLYLPLKLFFVVPFTLFRFDVIHLHDFYTLANVWIYFWAKIYDVPYVVSVHGCLENERRKSRSFWKNIFLRAVGNAMLCDAMFVFASSEQEKKDLSAIVRDKKRIRMITHPVEAAEYTTNLSKTQCRKRLSLPLHHRIYLYIGRLHPIKGLDMLTQAFIGAKLQSSTLIIAGSDEGSLSGLLQFAKESNAKETIRFFPAAFGEQKAMLFGAADIFVYPSRSEGFSLGILEAASVGMPVLITTACHFPAIEKKGGGLVVSATTTAIQEGLEYYATCSEERLHKMSKAVRVFIASTYSFQVVGDELECAYSDAAQSSGNLC